MTIRWSWHRLGMKEEPTSIPSPGREWVLCALCIPLTGPSLQLLPGRPSPWSPLHFSSLHSQEASAGRESEVWHLCLTPCQCQPEGPRSAPALWALPSAAGHSMQSEATSAHHLGALTTDTQSSEQPFPTSFPGNLLDRRMTHPGSQARRLPENILATWAK